MSDDRPVALVTPSGEMRLKSRGTRRHFRHRLRANLAATLRSRRIDAAVHDSRGRMTLLGDVAAAGPAAAEVFGVHRVDVARPLHTTDLDELADRVAAGAAERVRDRTFAVRVRRSGPHGWRAQDLERRVGARLEGASAGVDLEQPEVTVRALVHHDEAFLVDHEHPGPRGLPIGTQEETLALLSGGFDSAVAAWRILRRGAPVHFVHIELACAQTDGALAVARELTRRWAPAIDPTVWVVDFAEVRRRLVAAVEPRFRQVRLKELMYVAADRVAGHAGISTLVTGEALGQVSTQTLTNLALVDRAAARPVLRPLAGDDKEDIVEQARRIGTYDLSARSREVCDLSDGPVSTRAREDQLGPAHDAVPDAAAAEAADRAWRLSLREWQPGLPAPWAA